MAHYIYARANLFDKCKVDEAIPWKILTEMMIKILMDGEKLSNYAQIKFVLIHQHLPREREREIKFIGLFEDRGHRGPYSPYKPFNHNLYIGIIIFPHIDNPQSTGYN